MKRLYRFLLTVCAVSALAVSCTQKGDDYVGAEMPSGPQVFFPSEAPTSLTLSPTATSFSVKVNRIDTKDALTAALKAQVPATEDMVPYFDVPAAVSFAAGQGVAEVEVTFDPEVLGFDNKQSLTLSVSDPSLTTPYGSDEITVTVTVPAPWKSIGKGKIYDSWFNGASCEAEFMQNEVFPNKFKIVNPFGSKENPVITILQPGDKVEDVTITMEDLVYYDDIYFLYYGSYDADIYFCHPSGFASCSTEDTWAKNIVTEYQENGLPATIQIAPFYYMYGVGGWNQSQNANAVLIEFPGFARKDFSFTLDRDGIFYDLEENAFAVASIAFGTEETEVSDIAYIEAACVLAKNEDEALEALLSGEIETVQVKKDGSVRLPISGESGNYVIIAVAYDEEGEPQEYMSTSFEYYAPGSTNPWVSIGFCKYTDDIVAPLYDEESVTYYVEVLANSEVPGMYRIVHPYGADYPYMEEDTYDTAVHYFEIDATNPASVWFDEINLGLAWDAGTMYAMSMYAYMIADGSSEEEAAPYAGKLEDGKITFPVKSIIFMDDDGAYYTNPNGLFCLDLNNPLPERPEPEGDDEEVASSHSSKVAGLRKVSRPHSHRIGVDRSKAGFEAFSK